MPVFVAPWRVCHAHVLSLAFFSFFFFHDQPNKHRDFLPDDDDETAFSIYSLYFSSSNTSPSREALFETQTQRVGASCAFGTGVGFRPLLGASQP